MISKAWAPLVDGFLIGPVFALFLARKIVPYLVVVGVRSIPFFWSRSDYAKLPGRVTAIAAGLMLSLLIGMATGCGGFSRWPAFLDVVVNLTTSERVQPLPKSVSEADHGAVEFEIAADWASMVPQERTAALSKDILIALRLDVWIVALEAVRQASVFGPGPLSLSPIIENKFRFEHNHNQYLAWLVTGGAVVLAIGVFFLSTPAFVSNELLPVDRVVVALSATGLWGGAMVFDVFLKIDFYFHYFSLLLGLLFAIIADMAKIQSLQNEYI